MLPWLPENAAGHGAAMDGLMRLIVVIVGGWLLLAEGVLLFFALRFRARPGRPPARIPGDAARASLWVLVPALLILACDIWIDAAGASIWSELKERIPPADVRIRVEAQQFAWTFLHAGGDGVLDTADDVAMNGQLHVPVGKVVRFDLVSKDVIHSLWIPNLRLKQDIVPGRKIPGWFRATRTGRFPIACAELCGTGHGVMAGTLVVHEEADYRRWLAEAGAP